MTSARKKPEIIIGRDSQNRPEIMLSREEPAWIIQCQNDYLIQIEKAEKRLVRQKLSGPWFRAFKVDEAEIELQDNAFLKWTDYQNFVAEGLHSSEGDSEEF